MPSKKPKLIFVIDPGLLEELDEYRFEHKFQSRAAALMFLLRWALKKKPVPPPKRKDEDY